MGTFYPAITPAQASLLRSAPLFFVASVDPELEPGPDGAGPLNVSPKGGTRLHVLDERRVAYLDYPGSGDETARHARAGGPATLMACSFEPGDAAIVRLYGRIVVHPLDEDSDVVRAVAAEPAAHLAKRPRQVIELVVERTQTSCGYGVPVLELVGERSAEQRGRAYKEARA